MVEANYRLFLFPSTISSDLYSNVVSLKIMSVEHTSVFVHSQYMQKCLSGKINSFNCTAPHQNHHHQQHSVKATSFITINRFTTSNRTNFAQIAKINFQKAYSIRKESVFLIDLSFCMLSLGYWMVAPGNYYQYLHIHRNISHLCVAVGYVCALLTVENITYMCTKVKIEDKGAVESNCYTEVQNGREIEVCVCKSSAGQMPCNAATPATTSSLGLVATIWLILLMTFVNRRCMNGQLN